jgi:hypothetical protein
MASMTAFTLASSDSILFTRPSEVESGRARCEGEEENGEKWGKMGISLYKTGKRGDGNLGREKIGYIDRKCNKGFLVRKRTRKFLKPNFWTVGAQKRSRRQAKEVEMYTKRTQFYVLFIYKIFALT